MFVPVNETDGLDNTDTIDDEAKAVELFSYVPPTGATNAGVRQYATLTMSSTNAATGTTTYTYNSGLTSRPSPGGQMDPMPPPILTKCK